MNKISNLAVDAGKIILQSGGETYRVEDTINKISKAYNIKNADSFVTPTGIMFSAEDDLGNSYSIIRRVKGRKINLEKVAMINDLSRRVEINPISYEDFQRELDSIRNDAGYGSNTILLSSALVAFSFTLLFEGSIFDSMVSFFIGIILRLFISISEKRNINEFFINLIGGIIVATITLIFHSIFNSLNIDKIIIGSIMLLVPGVALINSIRDTIEGDLVSGVARALEALLIALAIAVGTGIVFKLWVFIFGGTI